MKSMHSCDDDVARRVLTSVSVAAVAALALAGVRLHAGPAIATITDVRRTVLSDAVRVTIELDREVPFHDERIPGPMRVFVDMPGTRPAAPLMDQTIRFDVDTDIVRQIRIGRHPNSTTRVVLDATDVGTYSVYPLYHPFRIVIDCMRDTPAAKATAGTMPPAPLRLAPALPPPAPLKARRLTAQWMHRLPSMYPRRSAAIAAAHTAIAVAPERFPQFDDNVPPPVVEPPPSTETAMGTPKPGEGGTTTPRSRESGPASIGSPKRVPGGVSMSRQLGLNVSRIVIDPGHGGHDPGAKGLGINEAEVVLDVALRLEKLLQKVPGVEVILTRRTDEFIPLQERTAIANREGADLFLSIHANASSLESARGIETYFLNFANNLSAAEVAARENAASGQGMSALPDMVKAIALNNKLDESRDFALQIQRTMMERLRATNKTIRDLGVKQAPFVVLIGAAMPSVLSEISFVTNPQEVRLLKGAVYRQRIAEALFAAVRRYQTSLKNVTTAANQR
jgi:N-acetylmuramoyl-L-alanine amidase